MRYEILRELQDIQMRLAVPDMPRLISSCVASPPISDPLAWAAELRRSFGDRSRIFGFWSGLNPSARTIGALRERHDFGLIDGRWLVDGWSRHHYPELGIGVYDLDARDNAECLIGLYGDSSLWEVDDDLERRADRAPILVLRCDGPDVNELDLWP